MITTILKQCQMQYRKFETRPARGGNSKTPAHTRTGLTVSSSATRTLPLHGRYTLRIVLAALRAIYSVISFPLYLLLFFSCTKKKPPLPAIFFLAPRPGLEPGTNSLHLSSSFLGHGLYHHPILS